MQSYFECPPLASLLKASWQAGVLILLVLAAQWALGPRLAPRWRCSLWLLVAVRLALPWTMPSPVSVFNVLSFSSEPHSSAGAQTISGVQDAAARMEPLDDASPPEAAAAASRFGSALSWRWPVGLWLAGVLALTAFLAVTHRRLSRTVARRRPLIDAPVMNLLEDCKQAMGVRVPVTLVETAGVGSPALYGFVRPRLLLPAGLTRSFSLEELRYVFLHELGHIKRRDIPIGWLITALQILHWFNPLVWLAFHRMRVDRELACDALALSHVREEENRRYGQTILKLLEHFGRSAWAPSLAGTVENRNQIKERIRMIAKFKKSNRGPVLAAALFAGLGLTTLTDAQPADSQRDKAVVGTWVLVGAPGDVGLVPAEGGRIKSVTDTHWSITQTDPKNGRVVFHHGGTYTLKGNDYVEDVAFANPSTTNLIGKAFKFRINVEGDTLTLTGIGNPWKEVWMRATPTKPRKADTSTLQGRWIGKEAGGAGACSLVVQGSSLEFRGTDTNEWYKATWTGYDTSPRQLVTVITDCSVPQYVGMTSYAIYRLEEGRLTVAGNEPGNPIVPASMDARSARKFVFEKK